MNWVVSIEPLEARILAQHTSSATDGLSSYATSSKTANIQQNHAGENTTSYSEHFDLSPGQSPYLSASAENRGQNGYSKNNITNGAAEHHSIGTEQRNIDQSTDSNGYYASHGPYPPQPTIPAPAPSSSTSNLYPPQPSTHAPTPPSTFATPPPTSRTPSPLKSSAKFKVPRKEVSSAAPVVGAQPTLGPPSKPDLLEERFSRLRFSGNNNTIQAQPSFNGNGNNIEQNTLSPNHNLPKSRKPLPMPNVSIPSTLSVQNAQFGSNQPHLKMPKVPQHNTLPTPNIPNIPKEKLTMPEVHMASRLEMPQIPLDRPDSRNVNISPAGPRAMLSPQSNKNPNLQFSPLPSSAELASFRGTPDTNGHFNQQFMSSSPNGQLVASNPNTNFSPHLDFTNSPSLPLKNLPLPQNEPLFTEPEFNFPNTFSITQEQFRDYFWRFPDQILIIDIRSRRYFKDGHIPSSNTICFEPIAIRHSVVVNDETLEDSLIMSPEHEQLLFKRRHEFPLVVYYDANTRTTDYLRGNCLNEQELKLSIFVEYLFHKAQRKALKRPPCLLLGGLEKWMELNGKDSIWKSVSLPPDLPTQGGNHFYNSNSNGSDFRLPSTPQSSSQTQLQQQAPVWKNGYADNQIVAPKPPQIIPSRPYGSRKGSTASPNHRLSFDGAITLPPDAASPDLPPGTTNYYPRTTADFFSMQTNCNPQSLQSSFPPSRGTNVSDLYSSSYNSRSGGMPKPPPPVVHVPQSQSQYPHSGINSGYAMGHAPGVPASQQGGQVYGVQHGNPKVEAMHSFTTGLTNLGNTCYMNCILQCIVATERLSASFLTIPNLANINSRLGYKGVLYAAFLRLLKEMVFRNNSYVSPVNFRNLCGSVCETFKGYEQQDAHEFLNFLLDGLHEELNVAGEKAPLKPLTIPEERVQEQLTLRVASANQWKRYLYSNNSPITTLVQGQYLSRLACTVCGTTSTTYNAFSCLSLPIPLGRQGCTLKDCFRLFTAPEVLEGDNTWHCPTCKKHQRTIKRMLISRLPHTLIVHLKRFRSGGRQGSSKLETFVSYPLKQLDLTEFWVPSTGPEDEVVQQGGQHAPFLYNLYAVATHTGTLKAGHYTSFVRRGKNGWCYFDDTRVYRNIPPSNVVSQNAYVLFFERAKAVQ